MAVDGRGQGWGGGGGGVRESTRGSKGRGSKVRGRFYERDRLWERGEEREGGWELYLF